MAYLLDTSILARLANSADTQHQLAMQAVTRLHVQGESLHTTPQTLIEFRSVATRPIANNGLGLSCSTTEAISALYESLFPLLPDTADVFTTWQSIVQAYAVVGKQVHDARLYAVCQTHGVSHMLTFNLSHFARFATSAPRVTVVDPRSV